MERRSIKIKKVEQIFEKVVKEYSHQEGSCFKGMDWRYNEWTFSRYDGITKVVEKVGNEKKLNQEEMLLLCGMIYRKMEMDETIKNIKNKESIEMLK